MSVQTQSLKARIDEFSEQMAARAPAEVLGTIGAEIEKMKNDGLDGKGRRVGDKAVDFNLPNSNGETVSLRELLKKGPVLLSFNRGNWCPFDNLELKALQESLPEIEAKGASLISILPQLPEKSGQARADKGFGFEMLYDQGGKIASAYGVGFTLSQTLRPIHEAFEMDIPGHNGDDTYALPFPATFVIDRTGKIVYSFVDANWMNRPEPGEAIRCLS